MIGFTIYVRQLLRSRGQTRWRMHRHRPIKLCSTTWSICLSVVLLTEDEDVLQAVPETDGSSNFAVTPADVWRQAISRGLDTRRWRYGPSGWAV